MIFFKESQFSEFSQKSQNVETIKIFKILVLYGKKVNDKIINTSKKWKEDLQYELDKEEFSKLLKKFYRKMREMKYSKAMGSFASK